MKITEKNGVEFTSLGIDEYETLENAVRANAIAFLTSKIEQCKLDPDKRFVAWRDARPDLVTPADVNAYVGTTEGVRKVLMRSLELSGLTGDKPKEIIASYQILDAANLARALIGFQDRVPQGENADKVTPKNEGGSSGS